MVCVQFVLEQESRGHNPSNKTDFNIFICVSQLQQVNIVILHSSQVSQVLNPPVGSCKDVGVAESEACCLPPAPRVSSLI